MKKLLIRLLTFLLLFTIMFGTSPVAVANTARVATVSVSVLNVRSGPGLQYVRIAQVTQGTVLPVLAEQPGWVQVSLAGGRSGWVSSAYVRLRSAPTTLVARVTAGVLNVRSGPGTQYARLTTVSSSTALTVLERQGDWLQVRLPSGQVGWVFVAYAPIAAAPSPPPAPNTPPHAETPPPQENRTAANILRVATVAVSLLNARAGPSTEAALITHLPQGTTLPVVGEQGDWLQVRLPTGQTAWLAGWFVTISTVDAPPSPSNPGGSTVADEVYQPGRISPVGGRVIVIDPGHGGSTPGAVGVTGLLEKEVTLDVSLRVAEKLRQAGAVVVMTRDTDTTVHLARRVAIAEAAGAQAFVSIHANSHPNRNISGTETYYYRGKPSGLESYYLAAHLQNELVKALGLRDIGVKHGNFRVIRETTMPV
ncbi:MAG: SH3 domain-containing protein [Bacillota bacterium]